jgi:sarcosine oxidase subunit gamma
VADLRHDFEDAAIRGRHGRQDGPAGVVIADVGVDAIAGIATRPERVGELSARAEKTFALPLPTGPGYVGAGGIEFIGIAPGRGLAMADARTGPDFEAALRRAFGDRAAICNLSDALGVLRLTGPNVRDMMAKCVAIDLHPRAFGVGAAATTGLALIGITLWRTATGLALAYPRSYAASLAHNLLVSSAEFGCDILSIARQTV